MGLCVIHGHACPNKGMYMIDDVCASRGRRELSRCRCIAALAACLDLVPQEDLDFPWPPVAAKKVPGWKMGPVAEPVVQENYLSWTTDCSKLAQVAIQRHSLCAFSELSGIPHAAARVVQTHCGHQAICRHNRLFAAQERRGCSC